MSIGAIPPPTPIPPPEDNGGSSNEKFSVFNFTDSEKQALSLTQYPSPQEYSTSAFTEFLTSMEIPNQLNILDRLVVLTHFNKFGPIIDQTLGDVSDMYKKLIVGETITKIQPQDLKLPVEDFYKALLSNFFAHTTDIPKQELELIYNKLTRKVIEETSRRSSNLKNDLENYFIEVASKPNTNFGPGIADFFGSWDQRAKQINEAQTSMVDSGKNLSLASIFQARTTNDDSQDDDVSVVSKSLINIMKPLAEDQLWEDPISTIIEAQKSNDGIFLYDRRVDRDSGKSMEGLWKLYENVLRGLNEEGYTQAIIDITDITNAIMTHCDKTTKRTSPIKLANRIQEHIDDRTSSESTSQALNLGSNLPPAVSFAARCVDTLKKIQNDTNIDIHVETTVSGNTVPSQIGKLIEENSSGKTALLGSFEIINKKRDTAKIDNFYTGDIHSINKSSAAYIGEARANHSMLQGLTDDDPRKLIFVTPGMLEYCARNCFDSKIWQDQVVGLKGKTNPELVKFLEPVFPEMPDSYLFVCSKDPDDGSDNTVEAGAPVDSNQLNPLLQS